MKPATLIAFRSLMPAAAAGDARMSGRVVRNGMAAALLVMQIRFVRNMFLMAVITEAGMIIPGADTGAGAAGTPWDPCSA